MARDKAPKPVADPEPKGSGRKRKKADDTPKEATEAKDAKDAKDAEPGPEVEVTESEPENVLAKRRKGEAVQDVDYDDLVETEVARKDKSEANLKKETAGDAKAGKGPVETKKKGKAKPKKDAAKQQQSAPIVDAPIVKVPSSIEKLTQLKESLEDGIREIEDGRSKLEGFNKELHDLEVAAAAVGQKMSQQESQNNRTTRRVKQVTKSLQEQSVTTEMLQTTLVTLSVRKAAKSKEPGLADVAATCLAILADWKTVVAQNLPSAGKLAEPVVAAAQDAKMEDAAVQMEDAKVDDTTAMVIGDDAVKSEDADMKKPDADTKKPEADPTKPEELAELTPIPSVAVVPGKTAPRDPNRSLVVGWLAQRIGHPNARLLETEIFNASASTGDEYKRCFRLASDLVRRGNVPDGYVRKIVGSWDGA